jgi:hypothetical protein
MAFDLAQATALKGKKVTVQHNVDGELQEQDGTLLEVNEGAIMFRQSGNKTPQIILVPVIEAIVGQAVKPKKLVAKQIKAVSASDVRQHLVERHGYALSAIEPYSPEDALAFHAGLDHSDLGHTHAEVSTPEESTESAS